MALDAQGSSFTLRSLRPFIGRAYESGALWSYEGGDGEAEVPTHSHPADVAISMFDGGLH